MPTHSTLTALRREELEIGMPACFYAKGDYIDGDEKEIEDDAYSTLEQFQTHEAISAIELASKLLRKHFLPCAHFEVYSFRVERGAYNVIRVKMFAAIP